MAQGATTPQYRIVDFGLLGGLRSERPSINNHGEVLVWRDPIDADPVKRAFIYAGPSSITPLNAIDVAWINDARQMAGFNSFYNSYSDPGFVRPALYGGDLDSFAMNNVGHVIGFTSQGPPYRQYAYLYRGPNDQVDLGTFPGIGLNSNALGLNDNDVVVGRAYIAGPISTRHAFVWWGAGPLIDIGTLGGTNSVAQDVNNRGEIIGTSNVLGDDVEHVFVYAGDGPMRDLGRLPGGQTIPRDINNLGYFVGDSADGAFLGHVAGGLWNLNDLIDPESGWHLSGATEINDSGWIVGVGTNPMNETQAFLLIPIPEPTSSLAVIAGGLMVVFARRAYSDQSGGEKADCVGRGCWRPSLDATGR